MKTACLAAVCLLAPAAYAQQQGTLVPIESYQVGWSLGKPSVYGTTPLAPKHWDWARPVDNISFTFDYGPLAGTNLVSGAPALGYQGAALVKWDPKPVYAYAGLSGSVFLEQGQSGLSGQFSLVLGLGWRS